MRLLRIIRAEPLEGRRVRLTLTNGSVVTRDLDHLLQGGILEALRKDDGLFEALFVQDGTLAWPNGADLCPDVLIWGGAPPTVGEEPAEYL